MATPFLSSGAILIFISILSCVAAPHADAGDFRLRIPNPLPRISKKIEKVGGFFFRTARRLEGVGDDDNVRRVEPSRTYPNPPYNPQNGRTRVPLPSDDSRQGDDGEGFIEQSDNSRGADRLESPTPVRQTRPFPEAPVKPNEAGNANTPNPSGNASVAAPDLDPRSIVKPQKSPSRTQTPNAGEATELDATAAVPSPEVKAKSRSKYLYGRSVPNRPGLVYPPDREQVPANMVDVRGIAPGTKVRDPATGAIFLVP